MRYSQRTPSVSDPKKQQPHKSEEDKATSTASTQPPQHAPHSSSHTRTGMDTKTLEIEVGAGVDLIAASMIGTAIGSASGSAAGGMAGAGIY